MRTRPFHQVDVFTAELTRGNPLAVVADADGLSDAQMAAFARWTNLSETTFLLPPRDPQADVRVRIFTPGGELPFAGHPTLGSCAVWLAQGGQPRDPSQVVQECGIGRVRVRRVASMPGRLAFAAPPLQREGALEPAVLAQVQRALGLEAGAIAASQWLVNGPAWATVLLHDDAQLLRLAPDAAVLGTLKLGVAAPSRQPGLALEVRAFAPGLGVPEDPVTGSLQAGLALWLIGSGRLSAPYVAAQGTALGRAGRVHVSRDTEGTWIGGDVVPGVRGTVVL